MKTRIIYKLKDNCGASFMTPIVVILFMSLLLALTWTLSKPVLLIQNVQAMTQKAVIDTAANNAYIVYNGVREGNTAYVDYNGAQWHTAALNKSVAGQLKTQLKLTDNAGGLEQYNDGLLTFRLDAPNVTYIGTSLRGGNDICLNFLAETTLHIPIRFGKAEPVTIIKIPMNIKARYLPLY